MEQHQKMTRPGDFHIECIHEVWSQSHEWSLWKLTKTESETDYSMDEWKEG